MDEFSEEKFSQFARSLGMNLEGLDSNERNAVFEQFAAYYVLRRWHVRDLKPILLPSISIGGVYDQQLDAVAILLNDKVITHESQIEPVLAAEDEVSLRVIFLQATTSNKFDRAKMNTFSIGVVNFWNNNDYDPANSDLIQARDLKDKVYAAFQEAGGGSLHFHLYYICLGNWRTDADVDPLNGSGDLSGPAPARKRGWRGWSEDYICSQLPDTPISAEIVDAKRLREWIDWVVAKDQLTEGEQIDYNRTIQAPNLIPFPATEVAASGYLGYISALQLVELLEREDGQGMMEPVFNENVRGFKQSSQVNQQMSETLNSRERGQFLLRNNGITIVCESASRPDPLSPELTLQNYQIVNGLQTSHVLYQNRAHLLQGEEVYIPVKIVITEDLELKDGIIESTNRQTVIKPIEYLGRRPIVRRLESHFNTMRERSDVPSFWLERRQGQFSQNDEVPPEGTIIPLQELLLAYTAAFLEEPHDSEKGIGTVLRKVPRRLLREEDSLDPYFYSAWLLHLVRERMHHHGISDLRYVEYHLVYGLRLLAEETVYVPGAAVPIRTTYFRELGRNLSDTALVDTLLSQIMEFLRTSLSRTKNRHKATVAVKTRNDLRDWTQKLRGSAGAEAVDAS